MPTLQELGADTGQELEFIQANDSQVEPLDGPVSIEALMDRFPETTYTQGRDTHLYKFVAALCGDAGAGLLKRQSYIARLKNEGELLTFKDLDSLYAQVLRFPRLKSELYELDPDTAVLTKEEWDNIAKADEHYRHRVMDFFNGARLGNSPEGMEYIAKAGSGVPVEVIENYKALFDLNADDKLGLIIQGNSNSVHEFVLIPRILDNTGAPDLEVAYQSNVTKTTNPTTGADTWQTGTNVGAFLEPDIERNMVDTLDKLRPVGALMTIKARSLGYNLVAPIAVDASSERIHLIRFITGSQGVEWPVPDNDGNFIVGGVETETKSFALSGREFPSIFHTIEGIHAYDNRALEDSSYNTSNFYLVTNGVSPYMGYDSEHIGKFYKWVSDIFPFLKTVSDQARFTAEEAIAAPNTPLVLEGRNK